ncbi:hypothetical protein GCM10010967_32250 [Dyadobacter beijingensis]|uniref:Uncharacterized protein n=1 Tax=Dyadobacter beijingensis TaxID=365489 RepID=A0ABQ2I242_9BACT|nr:hypothetical protein GCM10010967_32250 [Dyadobacter beijingensis]
MSRSPYPENFRPAPATGGYQQSFHGLEGFVLRPPIDDHIGAFGQYYRVGVVYKRPGELFAADDVGVHLFHLFEDTGSFFFQCAVEKCHFRDRIRDDTAAHVRLVIGVGNAPKKIPDQLRGKSLLATTITHW